MNVFAQTDRMGRLSTSLGKDVLNLLRFDAEEHVNALFHHRIEAVATTDDLSFDDLIGTPATVHLRSFDQAETPFAGIITEAEMLGQGDNGWRYALTMRPWIWLMGLRRKQQIYHNKTVVQILDEVCAPYDKDVEKRLTGDYPVLEYTVQYCESDLAFATRMMERFGISYHFAHEDGKHTLVLTDNITAHDDLPGTNRPYQSVENHRGVGEHFWQMKPSQRLTTGKVRLTDYNFKVPDAVMETDRAGGAPYAEGEIESYDYPGDYLDHGAGKSVARLRVDQERGQDPRHRATGDCVSLRAGHCVKVTGDAVPGVGKSLCLSARHVYVSGGYGTDAVAEESYEGQYLLMPSATPLRPELKTPRAVVQGPQTAKVVGDGEIDCDEFGRILVRFHWDLESRHSMRCRVSQNWASKGWGGMVIPRIGMEVVVEFLEGDPDKPLVTGCVYNGKNDVPYPLPEHKTKSVFRSDTHEGTGNNEVTFEDSNGIENIFVHAQKDKTTRTLNDTVARTDRHDVQSIGSNRVIDVGNNLKTEVGKSMNTVVGGTGVSAFALMAGVAGLAPHTAGMMKQAGDIAGGAAGLGVFVGSLASSALGFLSPLGLSGRQGVVAPSSHLGDAGKALKDAGSKIGEQADQLFPLPGVMNTIVGSFKSDTIGISAAEQVGVTKVVNVGKVMIESTGKYRKIAVGEEFVIECGDSKLVMKSNGEVMILGKKFNFVATDHFQMRGKPIDLN